MRINAEASDALLHAILSSGAKRAAEPARNNDPIAQLIAPSKRVLASSARSRISATAS